MKKYTRILILALVLSLCLPIIAMAENTDEQYCGKVVIWHDGQQTIINLSDCEIVDPDGNVVARQRAVWEGSITLKNGYGLKINSNLANIFDSREVSIWGYVTKGKGLPSSLYAVAESSSGDLKHRLGYLVDNGLTTPTARMGNVKSYVDEGRYYFLLYNGGSSSVTIEMATLSF